MKTSCMDSLDSLSAAINAINTTISVDFNKRLYKSQLNLLLKLKSDFGFECERQIYRCLFTNITSSSDPQRSALLEQLLADLDLFSSANWVTLIKYSVKGLDITNVDNICKCLKLNDTQRTAFQLALIDKSQLTCLNSVDFAEQLSIRDSTSLNQLTHFNITQTKNFKHKSWSQSLTEDLKLSDTIPSNSRFLYLPYIEDLLKDMSTQMESLSLASSAGSLTDDQIAGMIVNESGVSLTADVVQQFNVTPKLCAKILCAICENSQIRASDGQQSGQQRCEEIDTFADICREIMSSASPLTEIIQVIDCEAFVANAKRMFGNLSFNKNNYTFHRFWQFCINLCATDKQGLSVLGVTFFHKLWTNNIEFQFGFIVQCIKNHLIGKIISTSPTSLSGSDGSIDQLVSHLDVLKCQPDFESSPELNSWKYQRFYQILVDFCTINYNSMQSQMSSVFYSNVMELFKWPLQQCPDLVALGLLGCRDGSSTIKNELLNLAIPVFLGNHANAAIILHTIWNTNELTPNANQNTNNWAKQVLLQGMCDYYIKSPHEEQQQRLSRILDVAQDLKALNILLNGTCFPFVIDLACLASRREYLKLDKWLKDKIECNGESFVNACILFLTRRCPALLGAGSPTDSASMTLPAETLATMLSCLQQSISIAGITTGTLTTTQSMSKEVTDAVLTMVANSTRLITKLPRQGPPGVVPMIAPTSTTRPTLPSLPQSVIGDLGLGNLNISQTPDTTNSTFAPSIRSSFNALGLSSQQNLNNNTLNANLQSAQSIKQNDWATIFPEMQQNVSVDIEEEADSYFQRIYNQQQSGSLSIDDVLDMLRRFQDSPAKREREVFICMIRNLFKEYGFFPQYPDRELLITAQLFGGIIQMGLVKYMALVVALRYVLEALRKPHGSKMYYFGIAALDRFKSKLKDYPLYCQHLAQITHFREFPPHLIEYIECGTQSMEPSMRPGLNTTPVGIPSLAGSTAATNSGLASAMPQLSSNLNSTLNLLNQKVVQPPITTTITTVASMTTITTTTSINTSVMSTTNNSRPSIANATNIDTLLAAGETMYTVPPDTIQDKIAFIINNLSQLNLTIKTEEFKEAIGNDDQYNGWIAQYFVMKRASIEPNFHALYANFIEMLKMPELTKIVLNETHRNIKVLLSSDKEIANFSDRSLLKNLGHWLGMLSLAKNKPILSVDLELKNLLVESYHRGTQELLYIVPFIAKILESCAKSRVFKPPNPWTMAIIRALVELHQEHNIKLNLKFEVEVLCKTLNIDINTLIGKSNALKGELYTKIDHQLGGAAKIVTSIPSLPDHTLTLTTHHHTPHTPSPAPQLMPAHTQVPTMPMPMPMTMPMTMPMPMTAPVPIGGTQLNSPGIKLFDYNEINVNNTNGFLQHIVVQPNLQLLNLNPALKQLVRPAIERAVQEWIVPVVERSMKISLTTAENIIKKDFALDPDENHMCVAAHYLTRNLTAGMAMITCKDPLFMSIKTALTNAFVNRCQVSKELIEATAHTIATDNIDLCCCFIQKTAIEKALIELDRKLKTEYEMRRAARAEGRRYCDPAVLTYQAERMPEAIRLKVGPVTQQQMNVYEELGRNIPGFLSPITDSPNSMSNALTGQVVSSAAPSMSQFKPTSMPSSNLASNFVTDMPPVPPQAADAALVAIYDKLMNELEVLMGQFSQIQFMPSEPFVNSIRSIAETLILARQNPRDIMCALTLIQKVLEAIQELLTNVDQTGVADMMVIGRARDIYLVILKALSDPRAFTHQWTTKQITRLVLDRLFNSSTGPALPDELLEILIRAQLINFQMMDIHLAQLIESTQNPVALAFTLQFIKIYGHNFSETDFPNTIENLIRLSKVSNHPLMAEIQQIVDILRGPQSGPVGVNNEVPTNMVQMHDAVNQTRQFDVDPPGLLEKTERLLREWIQLYHSQANTSKIFQFYVQQMNLQGILKTDDLITRFFRLSTEMCVELCYRILNAAAQTPGQSNIIDVRSKCFHTLDAFTHLIVMLVKHSGSSSAASGAASETTAKLNLLNKVLNIIAGVATQDQDIRQADFQHLPYYRIFVLLFMELVLGPTNLGLPGSVLLQHNQIGLGLNPSQLDPLLESIQYQVLTAFCNTLHILRPSKVPSFAFAWLDFISHRTFMEKCLLSGSINTGTPTKGWQMYAQLLVDLIKFEAPFLRNVELPQSMDSLYKGTLKVFLVLLHDFPEFLCEYCYGLCDVIPCNAIQMRNLVLSAFPRNMRLPDPFTPNLKIDSLNEITQPPRGSTTLATFGTQVFKKDLDSYLRSRSPVAFLSDLRGYLQQSVPNNAADSAHYNIPLINGLVLYVGQSAIQSLPAKSISMSSISHSSHMDIFQNLAVALDTEGRYLFLNAIANQLRYPNSHTHYFSCTLLYLFAESNTEAIQEQITRVLLERLIVNRPHPWGLLVTFIELIKNPTFKFWNHEFVRCAPEIEKLFESVARSCNGTSHRGTAGTGPSTADGNLAIQSNQMP
ncbi:CCR4-NOT transcription complex subunit 1-like [Oppia nitens]|uniref:CCR4-NOT transcription complex subunit 1-like n=1 Tax=Oppia nitens TaxID=1686743 RepID=UPI0023DC696B|nr:CCR4-NOT transcription complex subunit 1-like [Oppia nitens]